MRKPVKFKFCLNFFIIVTPTKNLCVICCEQCEEFFQMDDSCSGSASCLKEGCLCDNSLISKNLRFLKPLQRQTHIYQIAVIKQGGY